MVTVQTGAEVGIVVVVVPVIIISSKAIFACAWSKAGMEDIGVSVSVTSARAVAVALLVLAEAVSAVATVGSNVCATVALDIGDLRLGFPSKLLNFLSDVMLLSIDFLLECVEGVKEHGEVHIDPLGELVDASLSSVLSFLGELLSESCNFFEDLFTKDLSGGFASVSGVLKFACQSSLDFTDLSFAVLITVGLAAVRWLAIAAYEAVAMAI